MSDKFEGALLESGNIMRRGYSVIAENIGKTVAIITATVTILLTFTDIAFPTLSWAELTTELTVMLIASYIIYFSLEDAGEKLGRDSECYLRAESGYAEAKSRISGDMVGRLRTFCLEYSKEELAYRQRVSLMYKGYTEEEYKGYLKGECTDKRAVRVFRKIEHMQPIEITPATLLEGGRGQKKSELYDPEKHKLLKLFIKLIPSALCMLFTVSMMITAKSDMTLATVIEGIVKLSTLPLIGLRGYSQGYTHAKEALTRWIETKTGLLLAFLGKG